MNDDAPVRAIRLRAEGITWREIDGELVILDLATSTYLTTNHSASVLLHLLVDGASTEQLTTALVDAFGIDEATAATDASTFVATLHERSLVVDTATAAAGR